MFPMSASPLDGRRFNKWQDRGASPELFHTRCDYFFCAREVSGELLSSLWTHSHFPRTFPPPIVAGRIRSWPCSTTRTRTPTTGSRRRRSSSASARPTTSSTTPRSARPMSRVLVGASPLWRGGGFKCPKEGNCRNKFFFGSRMADCGGSAVPTGHACTRNSFSGGGGLILWQSKRLQAGPAGPADLSFIDPLFAFGLE